MKILVNGIQLNATEAGSGELALVFLHFWGGSSREWSAVIQGLSGRYRCVALDARGSGLSDAPATGYRITDLADDVQGAISALGLQRYILVGHSMGGKTAQALAARKPAGLRGVVLVASSPASPMHIDEAQREQMRGAYASAESAGWVIDNVLTSSPVDPASRQMLVDDALRVAPAARDGWIDIGTREDCAGGLAQVDVPVAVVAGALDKVDPLEIVHAQIVPALRDPEVHILDGKGHLLPVETPDALIGIVAGFAARHLD